MNDENQEVETFERYDYGYCKTRIPRNMCGNGFNLAQVLPHSTRGIMPTYCKWKRIYGTLKE
jgi:hypothetical protein